MSKYDAYFNTVVSYNRIKKTLKNIVKAEFLHHYNIHPAEREKATKIARKNLTRYCQHIINNPRVRKTFMERLMLDTYYVDKDLEQAYSELLFRDKLAEKVDILWPQLRGLSVDDWPEYAPPAKNKTTAAIKNPVKKQKTAPNKNSFFQRIIDWF